jgi:hypothetical protein
VANLETFKPTAQTDNEVAKQTGALLAAGGNGRGALHDVQVYLQGINAYLSSSHRRRARPETSTSIRAASRRPARERWRSSASSEATRATLCSSPASARPPIIR